MESLRSFCRDKLGALTAQRRKRSLVDTPRLPGMRVERRGAAVVDFSSNDALGLSRHPAVVQAAAAAVVAHGAGATSSRLVSGNHPLFARLEMRLADKKQAEAALVFGSGFLANAGAIPALVGAGDLIVVDALAHASLMAGVRLSGADTVVVAHNDVDAFARALLDRRATHARCLVVSESIFSMDGDHAPMAELATLCGAHDAWLLIDDAHGFLTSLRTPATCAEAAIVTGTLSKATGSYGGYVCGPRLVVELLTSRARTLVYSTGLPPSAVAAALAALDVVEADPSLAALPYEKAARFCQRAGLAPPTSHIVPLLVGDDATALDLMHGLESDGFLAVAIRPPTVPAGTSRVRLSFSAAHPDDAVDALAAAVRRRIA